MQKLTPYTKLLKMGREAVDSALAPIRANSAKKKAEHEMAKLEERIATMESEIHTKCSEKELDFDSIINSLDEIALAERRKAQFERIIGEMFP
jgi:two-component sensor histidine kinase